MLLFQFQHGKGDFPNHHQAILQPPARCLRIQLNSDTNYAEIVLDSTGYGLSPTRLSTLFNLRSQWKAQVVTLLLIHWL